MIKTSLDESIVKEINNLTSEEINFKGNFAYDHELLWYGIDAVVHFYLFSKARKVSRSQISLRNFIIEQDLKLEDGFEKKISIPIRKVVNENIFIPVHKYDKHPNGIDRRVFIFYSDYGNRTNKFEKESEFISNEIDRVIFSPSDLLNLKYPYNVELGLKIAEEMFKVSIKGFNEYKFAPEFDIIQSEKFTRLGNVLIDYYSNVIEELKNQ